MWVEFFFGKTQGYLDRLDDPGYGPRRMSQNASGEWWKGEIECRF